MRREVERQEGNDAYSTRGILLPYLRQHDPSPEGLANYLQDFGFSSIDRGQITGYYAEPSTVIADAFPKESHHDAARIRLARPAAQLIDLSPEVNGFPFAVDDPDRVMYNLLSLATSLSTPQVLGEPLSRMYQRKKLGGEWGGVDHRYSLLSALTHNQTDRKYSQMWEKMLEGRKDDFVGGNEWDGFYGLVHTNIHDTGAKNNLGLDMVAVQTGLSGISRYLEVDIAFGDTSDLLWALQTIIDRDVTRPTWREDLSGAKLSDTSAEHVRNFFNDWYDNPSALPAYLQEKRRSITITE